MKSWHALFLALSLSSASAMADRIKDLTSVAAMRSNQLIGYGLVVGLNGTGDGSDVSFTAQSMKTLLNRLGVSLEGPLSDFETASSSGKIDIKNAAAVMVTAELPGFAKPGQKIDVNVSAIGKATNLRGGNLLLTSLRGADGEVYALAQGALTATGIDANVIAERIGLAAVTVRKELSECYRILVPDPAPGTDLRTAAVVAWIEGRRVTSMDAYEN